MKCKSCNNNVSSSMQFAMEANQCPFCGNKILSEFELKQIKLLTTYLNSIKFVTNFENDLLIKDRIIEVILSKFDLVPKTVEKNDLVVIEEDNSQQIIEKHNPVNSIKVDNIEENQTDSEEKIRAIKERIKKQISSQLVGEEDIPQKQNEGSEDKIERLKKIAKRVSSGNKVIMRAGGEPII